MKIFDWPVIIEHTLWMLFVMGVIYGSQYIARLRTREQEQRTRANLDAALILEGVRREHMRLREVVRGLGTCKYHPGLHSSTSGCKDWTSAELLVVTEKDFEFNQYRPEYKL